MMILKEVIMIEITNNRNSVIDFYRGIAVILIIILHAGMTTPNINIIGDFLFSVLSRFSSGMQLFFILSGYVIYGSFNKLKCSTTTYPNRVFFIKRASKLIPLYIIFLFLNILTFLIFKLLYDDFVTFNRNSINIDNLNMNNFLLHLFFLQGFSPKYLASLYDGSWSIVTEVYYYILFPFLIYPFTKNIKYTLNILFIILIFSMYFRLYLIGFIYPGEGEFAYYFFLNNFPLFLFGVLLYHLTNNILIISISNLYSKQLIIASFILWMGILNGNFYPLSYHFFYGIIFVFLILGTYKYINNCKNKGVNFIKQIGEQSYAMFLTHLLMMVIISFLLKRYIFVDISGVYLVSIFFILNLICIFYVTLLLSNLVFNKIDVKIVKLVNSYIKRNYKNGK